MRSALGISLAAAGAVLIWLGLRASDSFASGITRLFSGSPTKESVLLLTAGAAVSAAGLWLLLTAAAPRPGRRRRRSPFRRLTRARGRSRSRARPRR